MLGLATRRRKRAQEHDARDRELFRFELNARTAEVVDAIRERQMSYILGAMMLLPAALLLFLGFTTAIDVGWKFQEQVGLGRGNALHPMWVHLVLSVGAATLLLIGITVNTVRAQTRVSRAQSHLDDVVAASPTSLEPAGD